MVGRCGSELVDKLPRTASRAILVLMPDDPAQIVSPLTDAPAAPAETADTPDEWVVRSKSARRRLTRQQSLPTWGETPDQTRARRTALIRGLTISNGFSRVGIARAQPLPDDQTRLRTWIDAGMHGTMAWLAEDVARRCDPGLVVPGAQSVVVVALDYDSDAPRTADVALAEEGRAWVSRYAWGDDYHVVAEKRLKSLEVAVTAALRPEVGEHFRGPGGPVGPWKAMRDFRWMVDHGPALERTWAERAGLGWRGKHSLLIHPRHGSFFFLAVIITSLDLVPDAPMGDHCGSCTACLDACPTQAIVAPYVVDARKCISHATIEVEGTLPATLRPLLGDHLFGCDICQDVCPWNRFSQPGDPAFAARPGLVAPPLAEILALDEADFAHKFARSPLKRRGLAGIQDNARAIATGRSALAAVGPEPRE